jgi:hypothetical protein
MGTLSGCGKQGTGRLDIFAHCRSINGGHIIFSGGQTGTIEGGEVIEDNIPNYNHQDPDRYAYLTVVDPKTGDTL